MYVEYKRRQRYVKVIRQMLLEIALKASIRMHRTLNAEMQHGRSRSHLVRNKAHQVFIEYYYCNWNVKCTGVGAGCTLGGDYPKKDSNCVNLANNTGCWCGVPKPSKDPTCYTTEDPTNNFIAIRDFSANLLDLVCDFAYGASG